MRVFSIVSAIMFLLIIVFFFLPYAIAPGLGVSVPGQELGVPVTGAQFAWGTDNTWPPVLPMARAAFLIAVLGVIMSFPPRKAGHVVSAIVAVCGMAATFWIRVSFDEWLMSSANFLPLKWLPAFYVTLGWFFLAMVMNLFALQWMAMVKKEREKEDREKSPEQRRREFYRDRKIKKMQNGKGNEEE